MSQCTVWQSNQQTTSPRPSSLPVPKTCESSSKIPDTTISDDLLVEVPCPFGLTRCKTSHSPRISFPLGGVKVLVRQSPSQLVFNLPTCTLHADSRMHLSLLGWQRQSARAADTFKVVDTRPWQTCLG